MDKRRFFSFFLLILLLSSFISGCAGVSRIDDFFSNDEYLQHGKIIDFALFFVMFFALSYLGLTKVWGEGYGKPGTGKGAIVALSIALSLALAFALVTQTRFSITTIFPMAKAVFFLIMTFLLAGLIIHSKVFGEGTAGKVIAFIISALAIYLVVSIGTHMVCQMSDNMDDPACKSDFFNAIYTVLGRWFGFGEGAAPGGAGGPGGPGAGGAPTGPTGPGAPTAPTGSIQGGCRLDILFPHDSSVPSTGAGQLQAYATSAKALGAQTIYVYGFASNEGSASHNAALSKDRANGIVEEIKKIDPKINVKPYSKGETGRFGPDEENRRVVVSTQYAISSFMPTPGVGSLWNCTPQEQAGAAPPVPPGCGNNNTDAGETCDPPGSECGSGLVCDAKCQCVNKESECGNGVAEKPMEACDTKAADSCPAGQHCADDCSKCEPGPAPAAVQPKKAEGGGGWFHWWYLLFLLLIPLAFVGYRVGHHEVQRYKYGKHIGGINDELLKLIRLAKDTLAAVTQNIKKNDLSDDEKALFGDAVRYGSMGLRKRIERNLGPAGINSVVFAPYLTAAQRKQLIEGVYAYVKAMRKAKHIVEWKVKYWFWPKLRTLNKMKEGLIKAKVTPILHEDKSVTFRYYHRRGYTGTPAVSKPELVKLLLRPVGGAPAAVQTFDMDPVNRGRKIWSFKTTPLADGEYEYAFEVLSAPVPPGVVTRLLDEHNWKRTGNNNLTDWSQFTVKDVEDIVDEMIPRAPTT